jgi:Domain of unknown function (DUF5916)/GDP-mannose 4,6 dehydratase
MRSHCLITGGAGFIGSHLAEELLRRGRTVEIVDDLSTGSIRNIEHLKAAAGFRYTIARRDDRSRRCGVSPGRSGWRKTHRRKPCAYYRNEYPRVESLLSIFSRLPLGVTELACRSAAGVDSDSMYRDERIRELAALCDERVRTALAGGNSISGALREWKLDIPGSLAIRVKANRFGLRNPSETFLQFRVLRPLICLLIVLIIVIPTLTAYGQRETLRIPRVTNAPRIEDYLGERARTEEVRVADFRQRDPNDGIPASYPTEAYLSYDESNLYVIFVCHDIPVEVRARMAKREDIGNDDTVSVYLDTFQDRQRAYVFSTNPLGIQRDGVQTEGSNNPDYSYDTLWRSEGRLTNDGYVVLMAVPFKSLRFPAGEAQSWGLALGRHTDRLSENSLWPYTTKRVEGFGQQMAILDGIDNVSPGHNLFFIPYGAFSGARFLETKPPAYRDRTDFRGGFDSKFVLGKAFTLDVTTNPDFSQVESDQPQVTINKRFEVFFPEKRPFFIENSAFFDTPENLFFSRRIVDPQFGARLTGKVGRWAIGAVTADDRAPGKLVAPSDPNFDRRAVVGVARVQREFGEQNRIGLFASIRDFGSSTSRVWAVDTRFKLTPNAVFTGQAIRSYNRYNDGTRLTGPAYSAVLDYSGRHFTHSVGYTDRSPDFDVPLGFIKRVDVREMDHYVGYFWRPKKRTVVAFGPSVTSYLIYDRSGRLTDWYSNGEFALYMRGPTQLKVSRSQFYEYFDGVGLHERVNSVSFFTGWKKSFTISAGFNQGALANYSPPGHALPFVAHSQGASFGLTLRPTHRLRLDESYYYTRLGSPLNPGPGQSEATIFNNHIFRTKINFQFTRALSLRAIGDYNSTLPNSSLVSDSKRKNLTGDVLMTWLVSPFTALYVGYTDRYQNQGIDPANPTRLRLTGAPTTSTGRQVFVKLSYLLRF